MSLFPARFIAPEVHENEIYGKPVQPGAEPALTAKRSDLSKQVNEDFLGQILSLCRIVCHTQTYGIDSPVVAFVQIAECLRGAIRGRARQRIVRGLRAGD